jgi:hypothetical protein
MTIHLIRKLIKRKRRRKLKKIRRKRKMLTPA